MRKADLTAASVVKVKVTASKARNIPINNKERKAGAPTPRPLRGSRFPEGFPWLRGVARAKVDSANALYAFAGEVWSYAQKANKISVVENPASSWMWQTKWFRSLLQTGHWHEPHACEYGSRRQKKTGLLSTIRLPGMHKVCSGNHVHLQWGPVKDRQGWAFATSQETAYPPEFCKAVAQDIAIALQERGFPLVHEPEATPAAHAAIASQKQPRKGRGPVGPPEYATRVAMTLPAAANPPQEIPMDAPHGLQGVPVGSKLLWSREVLKGGSWVREVEYGVFHTPEAFLEKSLKIAHPFDSPVSMDAPNMRAIATILSEGVEGIKAKRKAALDYYRARKLALQKDELALKAKMHPA